MVGMVPVPSVLARLQRLAVISALVAFGGLGAAAIGIENADSASVRVLGAAAPAVPSCTPEDCLVEAKVTGFGARIGTAKKPFRAPFPGRIVAWSIKLGKPSKRDADCLTDGCRVGDSVFQGFGGQAKARLVILKPVIKMIKQGRPVYRLSSRSPVERLTPYFGTTTTFTLERPLKVPKGSVAALAIPTWAPVWAGVTGSIWRASRVKSEKRGGCIVEGFANIEAGSPQLRIGSKRRYGCT
jgi:hypothetical protein